MPAEECNNGMWKWGETGECKYETQQEAEEDNEDYYEEEKIKQINIWDKKYNNTIMEKRIFNIENRFETKEDGQEVVIGYGSIWNSRYENLG